MRWRAGRRSRNIEDRRGRIQYSSVGGGRRMGGGLLSLLPLLFRLGLGRRGIFVILLVGAIVWFSGGDLGGMLGDLAGVQQGTVTPTPYQAPVARHPADQEASDFVSVVLADTEDTWHTLFKQLGQPYQEPKLVLFDGSTRSGCGAGRAAMGPFYCPADKAVYIDLSFFADLRNRFGAPGDFAEAYVIAHEVGHHVQNLLGITNEVRQAQQTVGKAESNALSVRQELQADCFAGVWAKNADKARNIIEHGDIDEALAAANAIGDDRLQRQTQGYVAPDSFTHGSSEQRVRWFKTGWTSGQVAACDTFSTSRL